MDAEQLSSRIAMREARAPEPGRSNRLTENRHPGVLESNGDFRRIKRADRPADPKQEMHPTRSPQHG
jgi:hypothetical protein